jgi:hypothetical protein
MAAAGERMLIRPIAEIAGLSLTTIEGNDMVLIS